MQFSSPVRTDLVISMTLAEIFLLLLFVVWYGHTAILRQDPVARMKERLAVLETENERINKELKRANDQIAELRSQVDLWRKYTGLENPPKAEPLAQSRNENSKAPAKQGSGRGKPKCQENNVVVSASAVHGHFSVAWLAQSPELSRFLADSGRPQPNVGSPLTDRKTIQAFLDGVAAYYSSKKANECRFDYRLTFASKEDYFDGREYFEHYFSPSGRSRFTTGGERWIIAEYLKADAGAK